MSKNKYQHPLAALKENCIMLQDAGFSTEDINMFIMETVAEFEEEFNNEEVLREFEMPGFLKGMFNTMKSGFSAIGDSVKEKITRFLLDKAGISEGWVKEIVVKFVGNLTVREAISLVKGDLPCDVIMTKSAQTVAEVAGGMLMQSLIAPDPSGKHTGSVGASKDSQIGELFRGLLRNALSGSDMDSPLAAAIHPHMKPVCDFFLEGGFRKMIKDIDLFEEHLQGKTFVIKESFQKRMKVRLKKSMKTILDGGRKDLVKYGKPWNQGRQHYSNAFAANEANSVSNIQGAPTPRRKVRKIDHEK